MLITRNVGFPKNKEVGGTKNKDSSEEPKKYTLSRVADGVRGLTIQKDSLQTKELPSHSRQDQRQKNKVRSNVT